MAMVLLDEIVGLAQGERDNLHLHPSRISAHEGERRGVMRRGPAVSR
jgi:hypothetical protein